MMVGAAHNNVKGLDDLATLFAEDPRAACMFLQDDKVMGCDDAVTVA